jgi:hypothetical protein
VLSHTRATAPPEEETNNRKLELWLGIVVLALAGVLAWGLVTGLHKNSSHAAQPSAAGVLGATSPPVGARLVPLGRYASLGSGWRMKVVAVLRNVSQSALGVASAQAPGMQNIVVEFTVVRSGHGNSGAVIDGMNATLGGSNPVYQARRGCLGGGNLRVSAGHAATDNACFTVSSRRVRRLRLFVYRPGLSTGPRTWFALR